MASSELWTLIMISIVQAHLTVAESFVNLLERNVTSDQLLKTDNNGDCYFPPFCKLDVTQCNIPRIPYDALTFDIFNSEYYIPQKPVIIELCPSSSSPDTPCDLSRIIQNDSGVFQWDTIISMVRSHPEYEYLLDLESHGTPRDRANTIDIHPLKDKEPLTYKPIIDGISPPLILEELDIFNDLVGYLSTADSPSMTNKWVIFGTAGGGAQFHFDYYLSSFWNLVVSGSKYWVLTEPYHTLSVWNHSDEAIQKVMKLSINEFFNDIVLSGFLEREFKRVNNGGDGDGDTDGLYRCIQRKGDILYAPPIYYHSTVNLQARTLSVSRNMITKRDYAQSFNFLTQMISLRAQSTEGELVGLYQAMDLCAALYHYDEGMFRNSACWTNDFLQRLNSFIDEVSPNRTSVTDRFKFHDKYLSEQYISSCNYAREHAQFSSFR